LTKFCPPKKNTEWDLSGGEGLFLQAGFLLRILWYNQSGDHPESNLAKFGYILDMKVEGKKKPESFYVIGYLIELVIKIWQFGFIFLQNLASLGHFSQ
jgi:hypothetical protein